MARRVDYDDIATSYDRRYQQNDYSGVEAGLIAFVGEQVDQHVLEVGCGTGHWLRLLGGRGTRVTGLDASAQMLAYAKTQVGKAALAQGAAERLPWTSESFDRVFCINAFHHFQDKAAFLTEAMRVLRPAGLMMTVGLDPHAGVDQWYIYEYFDNVLEIDRHRYPASSQIREWMRAAGFVDCVTREIQHMPVRFAARAALEQGRLDKSATSQLSILTDEEYRQGIDRVREAMASAEVRGESLCLSADLRLYATFGAAPSRVKEAGGVRARTIARNQTPANLRLEPAPAEASMIEDEQFLKQAIELARQARTDGNHPFGALLVLDGRVVLTARNTVITQQNPTAHAEHNLVGEAIRQFSRDQITRCVLYTSCEPCAMCVGAMYWAGIRSVVYGLPAEVLATLAGPDFLIACRDLFRRTSNTVQVTGPLLIEEALDVHIGYWSPPAV